MKMDKSKLIEEFVQNAVIQGKATYDGDYKKGNIASNKLFKITAIIKKDFKLAKSMLDELLYNSEPNVKIWASGIALDIGYKSNEAERILTELSKKPELGILGLNAEMSLKVRKDRKN